MQLLYPRISFKTVQFKQTASFDKVNRYLRTWILSFVIIVHLLNKANITVQLCFELARDM